MAKKKLKKSLTGKITISRVTSNEGGYIEVRLEDDNSGCQFASFKMSLEDFGAAVTGQGYMHGELEVRGLDKVGKYHEMKPLIFEVKDSYGAKDEAARECQKHADEGWIADGYYSSQGSIQHSKDGKTYAHGVQRRWVDDKPEGWEE